MTNDDVPSPDVREPDARARALLKAAGVGGLIRLIGGGLIRNRLRRTARRTRFGSRSGRRRFVFLGLGLLIVALSVTTCSAGIDLASLTAEYGPPVPATRAAAVRFVERSVAAARSAPASRRLRLEVTEAEATSALSLGLMLPEFMQAVDGRPAPDLQAHEDLADLREALRARVAARRDTMGLVRRAIDALDPHIRSGDVQVRFTAGGEIVMAGYVQAWRWQQPALAVFAPRAATGELQLDFRRGRLGRVPAPEFAFDLLGQLVASMILQAGDYAEIQELSVEEGRLTFVGVAKK